MADADYDPDFDDEAQAPQEQSQPGGAAAEEI